MVMIPTIHLMTEKNRFHILKQIYRHYTLKISQISLDTTDSNKRKHMRILQGAEVVQRSGNIYALTKEGKNLMDYLFKINC